MTTWLSRFVNHGLMLPRITNHHWDTRPHFRLPHNGLHCGEYFYIHELYGDHVSLMRDVVSALYGRLLAECKDSSLEFNCIVGAQVSSDVLAEKFYQLHRLESLDMECRVSTPIRRRAESSYPFKVVFDIETGIGFGETALLCEGVLYDEQDVQLIFDAILDRRATLLPYLITVVNASGLKEVCGMKVISLVDMIINTYKEDDCPFCRAGSSAFCPTGFLEHS